MHPARLLREPRSTPGATWQVSLRMLRERREELSDIDVTPTQAGVLLYVQQHPGIYRQRVADALGLHPVWAGTVIRVLQQKEWLKKQRAPQDDRYVLLTLTQKGADLAREITRRLEPAPKPNGKDFVCYTD